MSRIVGIGLAVELATVPDVDKKLDGTAEGIDRAGEAAGTTGKASQVVAEFGIHALHAIGFTFIGHGRVRTWGVEQGLVGSQQIAVVPHCLGTGIQHSLQIGLGSFGLHRPANDATGFAFHKRHQVDPVFFVPMKVYSSSISTTCSGRSLGTGASGN